MVVLMLLVLANTVTAAGDTLDIEKVAIESIKNSQSVQSINRQVTQAQKNYADMTGLANSIRGGLRYQNSYEMVQKAILLPIEFETMLTQATNEQLLVTNAVRLSAYNAYVNLLKEDYALDIQQGLMNGRDAEYRKARLQHTLGMVSQSQFRLGEIAYLKAQYRYDSAQKSFNSASLSINKMMGEDLTKQYSTLQDYNITPAAQIKPLNEYVSLALANRADIINAQGTLDTKKKQYEYGKAAIPTDYEFYVQKQEHAIKSAQNDLELAKITVQQDVTDLYKTLESVMKNMESKKSLYDQALLNYEAADIKYSNSQISLLEFDNAKVAKAQADINYKNAQLDAWLMQTTMDSACGIGFIPLSIPR